MADTRAAVTGELGQSTVAMAETRLSLSTPAETSLTDSGTCNRFESCDPRDDRFGFFALCSLLPRDDRPAMCSPPRDDKSKFCGLSRAIDSKRACHFEPCSSSRNDDSKAWVIDSGASDHMTFDPTDFTEKSQPQRTCIANANGVLSSVTRADTVNLSPTLSLTHTLLVPSLSHKLLSVSQVTTSLNCVVLMYSTCKDQENKQGI